jgi:hypothetical protein
VSYDQALVHHLQRMLMADLGQSWEDVQLDDDGDVCFRDAYHRPITVQIIDTLGTVWARVWVIAAFGIKRSAKLLREVNELNLSLFGARAEVTPWGWLIVSTEVALESVEPGELGRLVEVVTENAERSGPMIQLLYGAGGTPKESREVES